MNRNKSTTFSGRPAFTLVELLVVLGLMLLLAALAVAFVPSMAQRQNTWRGSDRTTQWLVVARQWAKRDQRPTGVRLQLGNSLPNKTLPNLAWVTSLQYIQQPDDFIAQPGPTIAAGSTLPANNPNVRRIQIVLDPAGTGTFNTVVLERLPSWFRPPILQVGSLVPPGPVVPPPDFSGGSGGSFCAPLGAPYLPFLGSNNMSLWPVQASIYSTPPYPPPFYLPPPPPATLVGQAGDYVEIGGGGQIHQISSITSFSYAANPSIPNDQPGPDPVPGVAPIAGNSVLEANCLKFNSPFPQATNSSGSYVYGTGTTNYRIIRGPRILAGEQDLQLPQDVAIDLNLSKLAVAYNPYNPSFVDILFGSTGQVVGGGAATDKIILFVRDVTKTGLQGDLTLLTVNCRTGLVGAQKVDNSEASTTISNTSLTPPTSPPGPLVFNALTGQPQITVSAPVNGMIGPGSYIILDAGGPNPEVQQVAGLNQSGTTIYLQRVNFAHVAPFTVLLTPYSFALDPRTSGL